MEPLHNLLRRNFEKYHMLLQTESKRATNHAPEVLASLAMQGYGAADLQLWNKNYEKFGSGFGPLRPKNEPSMTLSADRSSSTFWQDQLGKLPVDAWAEWYNFFATQVHTCGAANAVSTFLSVPSPLANCCTTNLLHGIISAGYGMAVEDDALVAEGLAMIAIRYAHRDPLPIPHGTVDIMNAASVVRWLVNDVPALPPGTLAALASAHKSTESSAAVVVDSSSPAAPLLAQCDTLITPMCINPHTVASTAAALQAVALCVFACSGARDFALLHALTSSVGLPGVVGCLAAEDGMRVLLQWWRVVVTLYVVRGCPMVYKGLEELGEGGKGEGVGEEGGDPNPFDCGEGRCWKRVGAAVRDRFEEYIVVHNDEHTVKGILALQHVCQDLQMRLEGQSAGLWGSLRGDGGRVGGEGGQVCGASDVDLLRSSLEGLKVGDGVVVKLAADLYAIPSPPGTKYGEGDWWYPRMPHPHARKGENEGR